MLPWAMSQRRKLSNSPVMESVLKRIRPQKVIQSTFHTPVAAPYRYACAPSASGIFHTHSARRKVTMEPSSVASQAG
jgi:hypothetical protein